ncbi:hypothetical protein [Staphylococcus rostri]|uniref:DUF3784 domain-containing protein n=1 Tax=Staphylococcus rostri TaxID=522262 RepID=A0A2K3YP09_9STAP|nr:hypothetical protein [Staphylococcus rostri]PNZ27329.1 hypothetical protein CD122_06910 [Staphylococcus rostri]
MDVIDMIIAIILMVISSVLALYIYFSKNLHMVASIDPDKIPGHLKDRVINYFVTTLILVTLFFAIGICLTEVNTILSSVFTVFGFLSWIPFYVYCYKIQR